MFLLDALVVHLGGQQPRVNSYLWKLALSASTGSGSGPLGFKNLNLLNHFLHDSYVMLISDINVRRSNKGLVGHISHGPKRVVIAFPN